VGEYAEAFVGIDVAKMRNAIAEGARGDEVRYFGEIDASAESMRRAVKRIASKSSRVHFCYTPGIAIRTSPPQVSERRTALIGAQAKR
jgi:transposase